MSATREAVCAPKRNARRRIQRWSGALALLGGIWAFVVVISGGFSVTVLGTVLRSHDPRRPLIVGVVAFAIFYLAGGRATLAEWAGTFRAAAAKACPQVSSIWRRGYVQHTLAGLLVSALLIVGVVRGSTTAGVADSYGYLSEAELWLKGGLTISQPWASDVPWPDALWTFTPLGYTPSPPTRFTLWGYGPERDPWGIVPMYSPGLPLLMALGKTVGGACGPFVVSPLAGALLVLSTYLIGLRLGSHTLGLLAAILVATSPPFLLMHFVNMSDVPVAGAFALACWCALGTTIRSAVGASAAMAVALLIRPNLVPLVPVVVLWLTWRVVQHRSERRRHAWRAVIVLAGIGIASAAIATIYWFAYGSPFESGYGQTGLYFSLDHIAPNARNYAQWFREAHSPLAFLGVLALLLPLKLLWPDVSERSAITVFALATAVVLAEFLVYLVLDNSSYLRFFLVCYPFIMLGLASLARAISRTHRIAGPAIAALLLLVVIATGVRVSREWRVLEQGPYEAKLADVAHHVREATPENSVVLASVHSGSLRYYAGRVTLRIDILAPDWLDRAVAWMDEHGVHTYALLDDFERTNALQRFAGQKVAAILQGPPLFRFGNKVFYDLGQPPGITVQTVDLPVPDLPVTCWTPHEPPAPIWRR